MIDPTLLDQLRVASTRAENLNADGSINWDFVSADLHIDNPEANSEDLIAALDDFAADLEVDYNTDFTDWMTDGNSYETSALGEVY